MRARISVLIATLVVAVLVAAPGIAHACPTCAGRESGGYGRFVVLFTMIAFPFTITYIVYRVLRNVNAQPKVAELGRLGQQGSQEN